MTISLKELEHVAELAGLSIQENELKAYTCQLDDILKSIEKLKELDTDNVEPTAHILPVRNVMRGDIVREGIGREDALGGAPDVEEGQFKVPKIV
ncbi:MAG TPA: Asp-tRNA(Asn)/Glu-tRNA(Gln) amidotransferase subunit GatC [Clostridia bacterium]|nr:Asp-tRNA(Asn)/Glu-tRNA(Gln) amidotransferase subunit GatC [Clostridia bacterium]